jgi:hypothetical protein
MLNHTIISGMLPTDGIALQAALDKASAEGHVLLSTTSCAINENEAYFIATLGKPVAEPAKAERRGIGMGGGGPTQRPQNVDASPAAQSKNPGESA